MFKGFSPSVKPKEETESWEELIAGARTEKHLMSVRDVDDCSSKGGSYGSTHNRPTVTWAATVLDRRDNDAADELEQLKIAEHKAGQAAANCSTTPRPYRRLGEINDNFGGWGEVMTVEEVLSLQNGIVPQGESHCDQRPIQINDGFVKWGEVMTVEELQNGIVPQGGSFTGFGTSGALQLPTRPAASGLKSAMKDSVRDTSPVAVEQKSTVASSPVSGFKSTVVLPESSGFTGLGSIERPLSLIPAPDVMGRVRAEFGTLHVSGPAATIAALKEKERNVMMAKIEANEGRK